MVQLTARYTGRGPNKARTTLNTNLATVLLEDTLTRAEANLVAAGELDSVRQQRRTFHNLMRDEAVAAVEHITGRRVRAYMSDIDPQQGIAAHTFVFDTQPESGIVTVAETDGQAAIE